MPDELERKRSLREVSSAKSVHSSEGASPSRRHFSEADVDVAARYIARKLTAIAEKHEGTMRKKRKTAYDRGYEAGWEAAIKSLLER